MNAADELVHYATTRNMLAEEGAEARLRAYREQVRAEVLAEAAAAVESLPLNGRSATMVAYRAGVEDAAAAVRRLAKAGESRG